MTHLLQFLCMCSSSQCHASHCTLKRNATMAYRLNARKLMLLSHTYCDMGSILALCNFFSAVFYFRLGGQELELIIKVRNIFVLTRS
jgi:hypothetical protein